MSSYTFPSVRRDSLVLILGLGETGLAAALWCAQWGARLRVLDTREQPGGLAGLQEQVQDADLHLGPTALDPRALEGVDVLVLSPGLNPHDEPLATVLAAARSQGIEVLGEIELFARALGDMRAQAYAPAVLAVTGTNGKTTVTALTRDLVQAAGRSVRAVGNISPSALAGLRQALADDALPDVWVLELSSFQLETTQSLVLDAAAVLNLSEDHLDWHGSMQAYAQAKARLLTMARMAIVNRDDARVSAMVDALNAPQVRSFGAGAPQWAEDLGIEEQNEVRWLTCAEGVEPDEQKSTPRRGRASIVSARGKGRPMPLMPADALQIRGLHNAMNALAALALGRAIGLGWAPMLHALRAYRGESHRTEFVRQIAGVDFIEDSKGTNVGATLAALRGLGQTVVLIAGGLGKGQDFSPLAPVVREHARAVVLIGQDGPAIQQALADTGVPLVSCATLQQAVTVAMAHAVPGDAVLLSPACASMDMFRNYGHRAACFIEAVHDLAADRGEVA